MVFDRRFTAESPRYLAIRLEPQRLSDGLRPPLQDYCVLLTRSFLMVLGGAPGRLRLGGLLRPPSRLRKQAQGIVNGRRITEDFCHVGVEYDDIAAFGKSPRVFTPDGVAEVILLTHFGLGARVSFLAHRFFVRSS